MDKVDIIIAGFWAVLGILYMIAGASNLNVIGIGSIILFLVIIYLKLTKGGK